MTKLEKFSGLLQEVHSDIRLEVILTDLIAEGLSMEDVVLISNGLFRRNYHYDIEKAGEIEYTTTKKKKLCFVVNREGIYDQLPEDLFHQVSGTKNDAEKEEAIQEIKDQQELERQSRLFFLPFENEFYRQRVKLEVEERKFLFETNNVLPGEIFDYLWELPEFLDDLQKSKLGVLIPVLYKISGNIELITFIFESIAGDSVEIRSSSPSKSPLMDEPLLGEMQLNVDSIFGGQVSGLQHGFTIIVFLASVEQLADYMPGGRKIAIHEFLCDLLMPFDTDIVFELDFSKVSASFIIESNTAYLGRLNYSTII